MSHARLDESNQRRYGSASAFAVMIFLYVAVVDIVFVKVLGADVTGSRELKRTSKESRLKATRIRRPRPPDDHLRPPQRCRRFRRS